MADDLALGSFQFVSQEDNTVFAAKFGDGSPLVIDGYGGWTVTGRPKNIGLTEWQGRNPIAVEIPFLIDRFTPGPNDENQDFVGLGQEVEKRIHNLERLCGLGDSDPPPILKVDGNGVIPHDDTNAPGAHFWVIESVTWDRDTEIRSAASGRRLKCGGMITIRQYKTSNDILRRLGPKNRARKPELYTVKKGDTLQKIAAKKYNNPNKWKLIADANNLRDPRSISVGRRLRIPR